MIPDELDIFEFLLYFMPFLIHISTRSAKRARPNGDCFPPNSTRSAAGCKGNSPDSVSARGAQVGLILDPAHVDQRSDVGKIDRPKIGLSRCPTRLFPLADLSLFNHRRPQNGWFVRPDDCRTNKALETILAVVGTLQWARPPPSAEYQCTLRQKPSLLHLA